MKLRKTVSAVLICGLITGLSSCGSSGRGTGTVPESSASSDAVKMENVIMDEAEIVEIDENQPTGTVKVLIYYDMISSSAELVDLFETRYNGALEQEICGSGGAYFERLATLVASDLSPDIVRYEWISFPHGMSRNMYTPLDTYIDLDSDLWKDMKDIANEYIYNGKHYYYPLSLSCNFAVNYNKLVLDEYGLPDPMEMYNNGEWTWSAFRDLIVKWCDLNADHIGYTGVGATGFVSTTGIKVIDVKDNQIINNLKNENIQRVMEFVEDLCRQGLTGEGFVDPGEAFLDGNILFLGMGPTWTYEAASEVLFKKNVEHEMAFVPYPRDEQADKYYQAYDSFGYMVPSGAKNVKGAIDWITLCRTEVVDPENVAKEKEKALDSSPKYYPKCPECKYSYVEHNNEDLTVCPECGTPRREKFNLYYSEEQYEVLQDMTHPERGKFSFLFDNFCGFNSDFSNLFNGGETSILDGPIFNNASFTQQREENYNLVEAILNEYREKMAQG